MEPERVVQGVHLLRFEIGQVYLWEWSDGLTVVDTGIDGSVDAILRAIDAIGRQLDDVKEILLTHFHQDHRGGAAELARRTGASVIAHRADAPVIRGDRPEPPPNLTELERPIAEAVIPRVPPAHPVAVDREVEDGDKTLAGGLIVGVPGHTPGSIALLVPDRRVLFTGDTIAFRDGKPILGPFNIDRDEAIRSVLKQATLQFDVACFGHGDPIVRDADQRIQSLAESL